MKRNVLAVQAACGVVALVAGVFLLAGLGAALVAAGVLLLIAPAVDGFGS